MIQTILIAAITMSVLGLGIGVVLAAASKIFYVYVDPLILAVEDVLPGANCGGCGLPGCSSNAEAIVAGKAAPNSCVAAGEDVAIAIAGILGVSVEAKEPDIALPGCTYSVKEAATKFIYNGINDCRAAALIHGGMKVCSIGCLGLGTCAKACPFGAIVMGPQGLPVVDDEKCTGCGTCERVCPKHIIKLSSVTRRIMLEYTVDDCTTPCQRACPAGINIRDYIQAIAGGNYIEAVQIIKERNPFPTVIGRICPRPCEFDCRRKYVDEPVAINFLKRFAADYEKQTGQRVLPFKAPESGRKVAVVGGGVQGLSAAFFVSRLGHSATVFEATDKLGGLLRTAISKHRLPDQILDWDIAGILEMGIESQTGKALGKDDATLAHLLKQGFDSVFLASGGWDSRLTRGENAKLESAIPGTYLLLDILQTGRGNASPLNCGPEAVIVGGGKLAVDAVKILKGAGTEQVTILLRETEEQLSLDGIDTEELKKQGITLICGAAVTRLTGEDNCLTGVEYTNLSTGSAEMISAATLVLSSGRFPEMIFSPIKPSDASSDNETNPAVLAGPVIWEGVGPYKKPACVNEIGLHSEGDVLTDFEAAIKAIAGGRRAAVSLHQIMYGIDLHLPENVISQNTVVQNVDHLEGVTASPRRIMPLCEESDLGACDEIEKGFDEQTAKAEAKRCLKCGLICYQQTDANVMIEEKVAKTA